MGGAILPFGPAVFISVDLSCVLACNAQPETYSEENSAFDELYPSTALFCSSNLFSFSFYFHYEIRCWQRTRHAARRVEIGSGKTKSPGKGKQNRKRNARDDERETEKLVFTRRAELLLLFDGSGLFNLKFCSVHL